MHLIRRRRKRRGGYHTMRHYGHIQAYQNLGNIQLLSRRHERLEEKGVARVQTRVQTRGEARRPYFSCPQFTIRSEE